MNEFELGCAVLSAAAYIAGRDDKNIVDPPPGATKVALPGLAEGHFSDKVTGFEASLYQYQGKYIIAFAGTDPADKNDLAADGMLGFGVMQAQLKQAAEFYEKAKAQVGSNVTFTGHSLGGGLAALMGVFFDKPAVTFDPAPFRVAATLSNAQALQGYLTTATATRPAYAPDPDLASYSTTEQSIYTAQPDLAATLTAIAAGTVVVPGLGEFLYSALATMLLTRQYPTVIRGESGIKAFAVSGEFLTNGYNGFGSDWENALRIKSTVQPELIDINPLGVILGAFDLHSQALLVAAASAPALVDIIKKMPILAQDFFDKSLYAASSNSTTTDFLNKLVQSEFSTPSSAGFVKKFADDLTKLIGAAGIAQTQLQRELAIVAMEYYYFKDAANASSIFNVSGGGLHFKYSDIGDASYKSLPRLQAAIEGLLGPSEKLFSGRLTSQNAWHIQQGGEALVWSASPGDPQNDVALGGVGVDLLDGGTGADMLIGGANADVLTGGTGYDTLLGGIGYDTYLFNPGSGGDVIVDADGQGIIKINGAEVSGGKKVAPGLWADDNYHYSLVTKGEGGADLIISKGSSLDTVTIRDWEEGELGIGLKDADAPSSPPPANYTVTLSGNPGEGVQYIIPAGVSASYLITGTPYRDVVTGGSGNDQIAGGGGFDQLNGGAGNDRLYDNTIISVDAAIEAAQETKQATTASIFEGGSGDDLLVGGTTNYLYAGGGKDTLVGGGADDILQGDTFDGGYATPTNEVLAHFDYDDAKHKFHYYVTRANGGTTSYYSGFGHLAEDGAADVIHGGGGNDVAFGELGNDYLSLGAGNDRGVGGEDSDTVHGGAEDDLLFGDFGWDASTPPANASEKELAGYSGLPAQYHGNDVLDGGAGNDYMEGNGLDDHLYGGIGADRLLGDDKITPGAYHGVDYLDGGSGNDTLEGGGKDDELFGGADNDKLFGDDEPGILAGSFHGKDYLDGEDGNDYLEGGGNDDELFGGEGDDTVWGDAIKSGLSAAENGKDYLDGEGGNDQMAGGGNGDELFGGTGADSLRGDGDVDIVAGAAHGSDYLDGEQGDDLLAGDGGNDTLYGGDDNDELQGDYLTLAREFHGNDYLDGEKGNDRLFGDSGDDTLFGGEGNDQLHGDNDALAVEFHGNDVLDGGAGDDTMVGGGGIDQLFGGAGTDLMNGDAGNDKLSGGEGMDQLQGGDGADSLYGQADDDVLFGEAGADFLAGDAGNDQMLGGEGDDQLYGGSGDDILLGEAGNDILDGGGGADYLDGGAGDDSYVFNRQNLLEAVTAHGEIKYGAPVTDAERSLVAEFEGLMVISDASGSNKILFSGYKASASFTFLTIQDSPNDFALRYGDQGVVYIKDGLTHEAISSLQFIDGQTLSRADIMKLAPALTIGGAANADNILGGSKADTISGGDGDDRLAGGLGNDMLSGGNGSDTYVFNAGDGQDQIDNNASDNAAAIDALELGTGIAAGDVVVNRVGSDLLLKIGASDSLMVKGYFLLPTGSRKLDQVRFADNTVWGQADIEQRIVVSGATEGNDALGGFDTNDLIHGLGGNDVISGNAGNDELFGDEGDDALNGDAGNDTLDGGPGNDTMSGGTGSDTYLFGRGAGYNTISEYAENAGDVDAIVMAADLSPGDIVVKRIFNQQGLPSDLRLHINKGPGIAGFDDSILIQNFFAYQDNRSKIEEVRFADGTTWTAATLKAMVEVVTEGNDSILGYAWDDTLNGGGGDDNIRGYGGNDVLAGGTGKDTLYGDDGDDMLSGGAGNDVLDGGQGNDVLDGGVDNDTLSGHGGNDIYVLARGTGSDSVWEASLPGGSFDTVQLGESIASTDIALYRQGNDLVIALTSGQDQLWVGSFFVDSESGQSSDHKIEQIRFADGMIWDLNAITAKVIAGTQNAMTGTAGNDTFEVDHILDTVTESVNQGNDTIKSWVSYTLSANVENLTLTGVINIAGNGNNLDNVITGNSGSNYLWGGTGADTLKGGAGNDVYRDYSEPEGDVVVEAAGEGIDTIMSTYGGVIPDNVENFTLTSDYASVHDVTGNTQDNVITGNFDNNILDGGTGADTLIGKQGNDIYVIDNVADQVIEETGAGTDTVRSSISYTLSSNIENLTLLGSAAVNGAGNDLNNVLNGSNLGEPLGSALQWITGNTGANALYGGKGNDSYMLGEGDTAVENAGEGVDAVSILYEPTANVSLAGYANIENLNMQYSQGNWNLRGTDVDNILTGGSGNNVVEGGAGNDRLFGMKGNDWLDGGAGDDIMQGELGDDTYVVDSVDDQLYEEASYQNFFGGVDTVRSSIGYKLGANLERLVLTGSTAVNGEGNELNNTLDGSQSSVANTLSGGAGNDTYIVGEGDSIIEAVDGGIDTIVTSVSHTLSNNIENITLSGSADINGTGNNVDNQLTGNAGANILAGGTGNDALSGGSGNDTYRFNIGDGRDWIDNSAEDNSAAVDAIVFGDGIFYSGVTLERVGDDLVLNVSASDSVTIAAYFSADADRKIDQIKFADGTIWDQSEITSRTAPKPTSGNDVLVGTAGNDTIHGLAGNDTISGGTGDDLVYGEDGSDTLNGDAGNDLLDGGVGADKMRGGTGDDVYVVDATGDVVTENASEGMDTVQSSISYTLGSNVENLILTGTGAINGTGNTSNNVLTGNAAVNTLKGGKGNDTYRVGAGDIVTELSAEGTDTVMSDVTWTLGSNLENLTLTGTAAIHGTGNSLANVMIGNKADNTLDGGTGADTMSGGAGNDTYVVGVTGDVVMENAGEGTDLVKSSVTLTLGANFENLTLTGTTAINGTGNSLNNVLTGNSAANTLTGGSGRDTLNGAAGADKMFGGADDDVYIVDNTSDVVTENAGEGTDLVNSSVTYTLGANLENLTLTGTSAINGTGNAANNILTGNSAANTLIGNGGNDTLNGGGGADKMSGGTGNDIYVVDNSSDTVTENASEGIDQVQSSISYTLGTNVEALALTGTNAINGTGTASNNLLVGNSVGNTLNGNGGTDLLQGAGGADMLNDTSGNNLFDGGAGNDTITAGTGRDFIIGGSGSGSDTITTNTGADVLAFNRGDGQDAIVASTGKDNTLSLGKGVTYADLLFKKNANDLILATGASEQVTFKDWYLSTNNHSVSNLQIVIEGTTDYDASSASNLNNKKIVQFDFDGLATKFDQARATNPSLTSWTLSSSLLNFYLNSSDTAAIGGDLAYQYAKNGNLSSLSMAPAQALLASTQFGIANQNLQSTSALQDLSPRLL